MHPRIDLQAFDRRHLIDTYAAPLKTWLDQLRAYCQKIVDLYRQDPEGAAHLTRDEISREIEEYSQTLGLKIIRNPIMADPDEAKTIYTVDLDVGNRLHQLVEWGDDIDESLDDALFTLTGMEEDWLGQVSGDAMHAWLTDAAYYLHTLTMREQGQNVLAYEPSALAALATLTTDQHDSLSRIKGESGRYSIKVLELKPEPSRKAAILQNPELARLLWANDLDITLPGGTAELRTSRGISTLTFESGNTRWINGSLGMQGEMPLAYESLEGAELDKLIEHPWLSGHGIRIKTAKVQHGNNRFHTDALDLRQLSFCPFTHDAG